MNRLAPGWFLAALLVLLIAACAAPASRQPVTGAQENEAAPRSPKTLTIGVTVPIKTLGPLVLSSAIGGVGSTIELHSNSLVTADAKGIPTGQLAARVPRLEDGSLEVLPDGTARATYVLRPGISWQDGTPFTAHDLAFSHQVLGYPGMPLPSGLAAIAHIRSVEAIADDTAVFTFNDPYFKAGILSIRDFWPLPEHVLREGLDRLAATQDFEEFTRNPLWTSSYVNLGPFRVMELDPVQGMTLQAYPGYYQGRPKLDRIFVRVFGDDGQSLLASLLAGQVDVTLNSALPVNVGFFLQKRWAEDGGGTVHLGPGAPWYMESQWRPALQLEPAVWQQNVRVALYEALDKEALSEGLFDGHPEFAAYAILPPGDRNYEAVRDGLRVYSYNPTDALARLRDAGWVAGPDGALRHVADGRTLHTAVQGTPARQNETAALADSWRRLGAEVDERVLNPNEYLDVATKNSYRGWYSTTAVGADQFLDRFVGVPAGPETGWAGNGSGYQNPEAARLTLAYRSSISAQENMQAMKAVGEFVVAQLPIFFTWYNALQVSARKGVIAFDDFSGGTGDLGSFSRAAYLWDVQ